MAVPWKGHREEAHFYADDIQPPLIFFVSARRTSADNTEFKKKQVENEKGGKETCICVCLHVKSTQLRRDFNQGRSLLFDICINVSSISVKWSILSRWLKKHII